MKEVIFMPSPTEKLSLTSLEWKIQILNVCAHMEYVENLGT